LSSSVQTKSAIYIPIAAEVNQNALMKSKVFSSDILELDIGVPTCEMEVSKGNQLTKVIDTNDWIQIVDDVLSEV
jgi:hypothetical protein